VASLLCSAVLAGALPDSRGIAFDRDFGKPGLFA